MRRCVSIGPLPLTKTLTLLGLAAVRPSSFLLPVSADTGPQLNIDPRRCLKAETLRYFHEVELVDIENGAEAV